MNTDWMDQGKCKGLAWEMFFPGDGTGLSAAQKICAECPVSTRCLEYAIENHIAHGIWGGCSERERKRVVRRRSGQRTVTVG
jgi:WhiB family redox-sensing transcriptional regulator